MAQNRIKLTNEELHKMIAEVLDEELKNVIHKDGDKWKIKGHHGDWNAEYDSKEDAEKGLKAYFANKKINEEIMEDNNYLITLTPYLRDFYGCVEISDPESEDEEDVDFYNFNVRPRNGQWRIVWDSPVDDEFRSEYEPLIWKKFHTDYPDPESALKINQR